MHNLGPTREILDIKIDRDRFKCSLTISQQQYCIDMLNCFTMADCRPVTTPMDPGSVLSDAQQPESDVDKAFMCSVNYGATIGSLQYLSCTTCPDIAYYVDQLASFTTNPGIARWTAVKHLFHYIKGTINYGIRYSPDTSTSQPFLTFSDTNHGGYKDSGHSTGTYIIKIGTGAVFWSSKCQSIVILSTTEAEYIAACKAGKEIIWMHQLL